LVTKSCFFQLGVATRPRIVTVLLGGLVLVASSNYFRCGRPTIFILGGVISTSSSFFWLVLLTSMELAFGVWVGNVVLLTLMIWASKIIDDTLVPELGKESFMSHFEA